MDKKIFIGSICIALFLISTPVVSSFQAPPSDSKDIIQKQQDILSNVEYADTIDINTISIDDIVDRAKEGVEILQNEYGDIPEAQEMAVKANILIQQIKTKVEEAPSQSLCDWVLFQIGIWGGLTLLMLKKSDLFLPGLSQALCPAKLEQAAGFASDDNLVLDADPVFTCGRSVFIAIQVPRGRCCPCLSGSGNISHGTVYR